MVMYDGCADVEMSAKPPQYTHIKKNVYVAKIKPEWHESEVGVVVVFVSNCINDQLIFKQICVCAVSGKCIGRDGLPRCGDECYNRLLRVECCGDGKVSILLLTYIITKCCITFL
jgi:hypothetical protein